MLDSIIDLLVNFVKRSNKEIAMKNTKEILNDGFASAHYDASCNAVIFIWKKPSTSEAFRLIFSEILKAIKGLKVTALISDIHRQGIVGIENRIWLQNEILPKAYRDGLRRIAVIAPKDVFSSFYVESVKNVAVKNSFNLKFKYLEDIDSARAWIMNEEVTV